MNTNTNNLSPKVKKWAKMIGFIILAFLGFSYLNRHGISPVWAAVLIVLFPGIFRFLYKIICFLVAVALFIALLGYLIF